SPDERKAAAEKILTDVGMAERMQHRPNELSGGQRQKVAIARALAVNPDVIVADEPTGNLDSASGEQILNIIKELHEKKGKTVLMVTHERYVAEKAEKILHLRDGMIVEREEITKKRRGG
ncbi:MAG: ATP-binding cassette domain-containing protein, partial [Candidatus Diapherotrites archaeon]|nr:ATP-binding cassette domain-containing protein [Candidatus Diapherotrites archaeon]